MLKSFFAIEFSASLNRYDGRHFWVAPATFTSSCRVNTEYFPFDGQACQLKFGSWTLNAAKLVILKDGDGEGVVGPNYVPSTEWNIVDTEVKFLYEG